MVHNIGAKPNEMLRFRGAAEPRLGCGPGWRNMPPLNQARLMEWIRLSRSRQSPPLSEIHGLAE